MARILQEIVVLHLAIDREKDALGLYLGLAAASRDPAAKNVLIHLAADELGHLDKLERHLVFVIKGKRGLLADAGAALADAMAGRLAEGAGDAPSIGGPGGEDEVAVLRRALDLELETNRRYIEMAASAATGEGKEVFLSLAKEEETHARILRAEIDSIGENGFWFDIQEFTMEQ